MKICLLSFIAVFTAAPVQAQPDLKSLYEPQVFDGLPVRIMKPHGFDATKRYPVIVSLHGAGGRGTNNGKQLKDWNRQLAEPKRRQDFPCYVVAPQANELWNAIHLQKTQALIKTLPSVDMDRIYIMGHSMGGHGSYIFIQLDTKYFAAAAPSAGAGRGRTGDFIDAEKIKDIPIWAFHGDKDRVCPYERARKVFAQAKALGGNMKLTTWAGDNHGVSGKMIPGADNGTTEFTSDRCDKVPDLMTWMFSRSKKFGELDQQAREVDDLRLRIRESFDYEPLRREAEYLLKTVASLRKLKTIRGRITGLSVSVVERRRELQATAERLHAQIEADEEFVGTLARIAAGDQDEVEEMTVELSELRAELEGLRQKLPNAAMVTQGRDESLAKPNTSDSPTQSAGRLDSGEYFVTQTWSQEHNFRRPYFVNVPPVPGASQKLPVFIFLHGNGGNAKDAMRGWLRSRRRIAEQYILVFAQGYKESWNIVSERSKADDVGFIESIVKQLARYENVAANEFTIMGSSNGAALVNQLAIECRLPNIRNYISGVSPLNVWQYDGKQFKAKGDDNNYRVVAVPMTGKRLLNISGTEDRLVPYKGGPSPGIPAKDGKLAFVSAEESTFLWAKAMGYEGEQLTKPTTTVGDIEFFSYLDGNVVHCKVNNAGHGATHQIKEETLLDFLQN